MSPVSTPGTSLNTGPLFYLPAGHFSTGALKDRAGVAIGTTRIVVVKIEATMDLVAVVALFACHCLLNRKSPISYPAMVRLFLKAHTKEILRTITAGHDNDDIGHHVCFLHRTSVFLLERANHRISSESHLRWCQINLIACHQCSILSALNILH